ncbi:MAG: hypothetical protein GX811_05105, partial [Lentisphaerae bacterium]|nr:hypothetical protein [Lentisphaerota bacterium]
RFPVHPADLEKYGSAANIDGKHVTRLFNAVREKHPGFQMIFCQPFYWGPGGREPYPEPREPYLKAMAEDVHPEIDLVWTGNIVKGQWKTQKHVEWFIDLTKHKPMIYQNATGQHHLLSYINDRTPGFLDWHDGHPGFFDEEISGFMHNADVPTTAITTIQMADCFWNPATYIPATEDGDDRGEAAVRRASALLYGKEMFDILEPAWKAMSYFDKFKYGAYDNSALAELDKLEALWKTADEAWQKAVEYNPKATSRYPASLRRAIYEFSANVIKTAKQKKAASAK